MPPIKDDIPPPVQNINTSAQIQQIFSEVQSQLPSIDFDSDDLNDDNNDINEAIFQPHITENTDSLLQSLINNTDISLLTLHPKLETPQQPPNVELQTRTSPNLFDNSLQNPNQDQSPKLSVLSMDLFNSIDFDKLTSITSNNDLSQQLNLTPTFHRPRPNNQFHSSPQRQTNTKHRDDSQILERLTLQANKFNMKYKTSTKQETNSFRNLEAALFSNTYQHFDQHGKNTGIPESRRKTIYLDLRNSNPSKHDEIQHEHQQQVNNSENVKSQEIPSSDSESDDDNNDGMLWFEKRRQQQQQNTSEN